MNSRGSGSDNPLINGISGKLWAYLLALPSIFSVAIPALFSYVGDTEYLSSLHISSYLVLFFTVYLLFPLLYIFYRYQGVHPVAYVIYMIAPIFLVSTSVIIFGYKANYIGKLAYSGLLILLFAPVIFYLLSPYFDQQKKHKNQHSYAKEKNNLTNNLKRIREPRYLLSVLTIEVFLIVLLIFISQANFNGLKKEFDFSLYLADSAKENQEEIIIKMDQYFLPGSILPGTRLVEMDIDSLDSKIRLISKADSLTDVYNELLSTISNKYKAEESYRTKKRSGFIDNPLFWFISFIADSSLNPNWKVNLLDHIYKEEIEKYEGQIFNNLAKEDTAYNSLAKMDSLLNDYSKISRLTIKGHIDSSLITRELYRIKQQFLSDSIDNNQLKQDSLIALFNKQKQIAKRTSISALRIEQSALGFKQQVQRNNRIKLQKKMYSYLNNRLKQGELKQDLARSILFEYFGYMKRFSLLFIVGALLLFAVAFYGYPVLIERIKLASKFHWKTPLVKSNLEKKWNSRHETLLIGMVLFGLLLIPMMGKIEKKDINVLDPFKSFTLSTWYMPNFIKSLPEAPSSPGEGRSEEPTSIVNEYYDVDEEIQQKMQEMHELILGLREEIRKVDQLEEVIGEVNDSLGGIRERIDEVKNSAGIKESTN